MVIYTGRGAGIRIITWGIPSANESTCNNPLQKERRMQTGIKDEILRIKEKNAKQKPKIYKYVTHEETR